jgi:hypothetical protein
MKIPLSAPEIEITDAQIKEVRQTLVRLIEIRLEASSANV